MNPRWWLGCLATLALLLPSAVLAQKANKPKPFYNPQIQVQVRTDDNSQPPLGVRVIMEFEDGSPVDELQTDSSGKCKFVPPSPAIYVIRAKQPGYLEATSRVDLQNTMTGMAILLLKPIPGQPPQGNAAGASVSVGALTVPEAARKELDRATQLLQNHDLDEGIAHLKKAIELHDQYPQAYTMLGTAYTQQKKWQEAQGALQKAIQQDPNEADAYFQLGATLNQEKDYAGAEKALKQGFQLVPEPAEAAAAHYELAFACFSQGHWHDAEPQVAKTIATQPDFALAHWLMAQIMLKKGDGQGAINEFQTYLKLDPNGPAAASVRAVIPKIQAAIAKK
jgi:Tfp pilus assembly protein PilF